MKAGWGLTRKKTCKRIRKKGYRRFKVLKKAGYKKLPAGCGKGSKKKKYRCYKVRFGKGKKHGRGYKKRTGIICVRKKKRLKVGGCYRIKKTKRCGKYCRVHFKRCKRKRRH